MTERVAIIDLGSNSARLVIMHIYHNGAYNLVYHQKEAVRLSKGMGENQRLQPEAMERAISTLKVFSHMCQLFNVDSIMAVATAAVRNAKNGPEFIQMVRRQTDIPIQEVSGEAEALLGFLGVINTIDITDAVLVDLGGGSTELTYIKDRRAQNIVSLPFGAINLTEKFDSIDKISDKELEEMRQFIHGYLDLLPWLKNLSVPIIGIGGTARNLAKIDQKRKNYPLPKLHNYRLGPIALEEMWKTLCKANLKQRRKIPGLSSERADIIIAGSTIFKSLFDVVRGTNLIVSGCGVREGMFLRYYLSREGRIEIIPDILDHSTQNLLLFYKGDTNHANRVAHLAQALFDGLRPLHYLGERERTLLTAAAQLHDIGITIDYYGHPRHSAYLVENARLFGLTHREQVLLALLVGWHNGPSTKYVRKIESEFLDEAAWQLVHKLSVLLALAESLDSTQLSLVRGVQVLVKDEQVKLILDTDDPVIIERQELDRHRRWFKKVYDVDLLVQ